MSMPENRRRFHSLRTFNHLSFLIAADNMHDDSLHNSLCQDAYNSLIFKIGRGRELYLVGGYIRDTLRGILSHDRDYSVRGDVVSFAVAVQNKIGGTIVRFRWKDTIRIALKSGQTLDFSRIRGNLAEDLSGRDFTMNALAWNPRRGIIDLHNGRQDMERGIVRAISPKNLINDPLRMLRAYRFSAETNGTIDMSTRRIIRRNRLRILASPAERITLEIFNLLNAPQASRHLKMALRDRLLNTLLPLNYNTLQGNLNALVTFETVILHLLPVHLKVLLHDIFAQNLSYKGLLCLSILLRDSRGLLKIKHLAMCTKITNRLRRISEGLAEMQGKKRLRREKVFRIFKNARDAAPDILIVHNKVSLLRELRKFRKIWKRSVLTPEEVARITGVTSGYNLGKIITLLKEAEYKGVVRSRDEAEEFIGNL